MICFDTALLKNILNRFKLNTMQNIQMSIILLAE